jgi:hypothetical protein
MVACEVVGADRTPRIDFAQRRPEQRVFEVDVLAQVPVQRLSELKQSLVLELARRNLQGLRGKAVQLASQRSMFAKNACPNLAWS